MEESIRLQTEQLLKNVPGGIAKLAFDDVLTILYATDTFYSLIKNVTEKLNASVTPALLKIVYSADIIYVTQQLATQKNRKDNLININFRTLQQDGSFKWVMVTGSKSDEVYTSGTKTVPVYSCIAMDVTDHMLKYKKLEQTNGYHRTISELSKELYFEYEIASDTLTFSELFREVFGKDSHIPGFRKKLEKTKMIHEHELPIVNKVFNSMMGGKKQVRFEVRLIPKDGVPVWYICYASIIFDENKNPYKVVGKLAMTNPGKKEAEVTPPKQQLDAQTMVCTKASAESLITDAINKQDKKSLSAMFLIEVRNYKGINEIIDSLDKENILVTVAGFLKARFRSSDVIGRMSMNEFAVYMRDVRSDQIVYEQAENICKELDSLYSYTHGSNGLLISIGIAFSNGQQDYHKLLANANTALVMSKKANTSSFEVFIGAM